MDFVSALLSALVVGLVIGGVARLVMSGRQNVSLFMTCLVGFGAALLGGLLAQFLGLSDTAGVDWIQFGIQVFLATIGIAAFSR